MAQDPNSNTYKINRSGDHQKLNEPDQKTSTTSLLRYPITLGDNDDGQNNYVLFNINVQQASRYQEDPSPNGNITEQGLASGSIDATGVSLVSQQTNASGGPRRSNNPVFRGGTRRIATAIAIYMPGGFQVAESTDWSTVELGTAGRLASSLGYLSSGNFSGIADRVGNLIRADAVGRGAARATAKAADEVLSTNFSDAVSINFRRIVNPQAEVAFKGKSNRSFQFEFKFTPTSREEAEMVLEIIKQFRYHAAPEFDGVNNYELIYPSEFDIAFYHVPESNDNTGAAIRNTSLPKLETCALTNVSVNYSPFENFVTFEDGIPVEINISLTFTELSIIDKKRIKDGY